MTAVKDAAGLDELEQIRVSAFGKKGRITELMRGLGAMKPEARKEAGQSLNALKNEVAEAIEEKKRTLGKVSTSPFPSGPKARASFIP